MGIFGPGKKDLEKQVDELQQELLKIKLTIEQTQYLDLNKEIHKLIEQKNDLKNEHINIKKDIDIFKRTLLDLEDISEMQSFGIYKPKYNFESSELYKRKLDQIRNNQKELIKNKTATTHPSSYLVDGNTKMGKEFISDTIKLSLRAFNNECDNIISKTKFNNVNKSSDRIKKIYKEINDLTDMQHVSITHSYLNLKIEELYLKYEYECKLQKEKEEQLEIKERIREEAKALRELESARKKLEKEETHFNIAISDINIKLQNASEKEKNILLNKLKELESKLLELNTIKKDLSNREQNTRAGYVYVISNIGSFGDNIYKIGMTRRLEPMDRVKELGDASVPFAFDVHAMIFSEDAPSLENALHKRFEDRSVNRVNLRKEFFNVSLIDIKHEIEKNHNATIEFTMIAEASEYRQSLAMLKTSSVYNKSNILIDNNCDSIINVENTKSPTTLEETEALDLLKDMLGDIINKNDITYKSNSDCLEVFYKNNCDTWICKLFLNQKPQKGLHIPNENKDTIKFDFDEINDLKEIKDMFYNIAKSYI